jgi:hypothetical protein
MNAAATGGGTTKNWNSRSPTKPSGPVDWPVPGDGLALGLGLADADGSADADGLALADAEGLVPGEVDGLALTEGLAEALGDADPLGDADGLAEADAEMLGEGLGSSTAWLAAPWVSARNVARMLIPTGIRTDLWRSNRGR